MSHKLQKIKFFPLVSLKSDTKPVKVLKTHKNSDFENDKNVIENNIMHIEEKLNIFNKKTEKAKDISKGIKDYKFYFKFGIDPKAKLSDCLKKNKYLIKHNKKILNSYLNQYNEKGVIPINPQKAFEIFKKNPLLEKDVNSFYQEKIFSTPNKLEEKSDKNFKFLNKLDFEIKNKVDLEEIIPIEHKHKIRKRKENSIVDYLKENDSLHKRCFTENNFHIIDGLSQNASFINTKLNLFIDNILKDDVDYVPLISEENRTEKPLSMRVQFFKEMYKKDKNEKFLKTETEPKKKTFIFTPNLKRKSTFKNNTTNATTVNTISHRKTISFREYSNNIPNTKTKFFDLSPREKSEPIRNLYNLKDKCSFRKYIKKINKYFNSFDDTNLNNFANSNIKDVLKNIKFKSMKYDNVDNWKKRYNDANIYGAKLDNRLNTQNEINKKMSKMDKNYSNAYVKILFNK